MSHERDDKADAARWRWVREHAHIGLGEDGEVYLGGVLLDEVPSAGAETPEEVDVDACREAAPWLNEQQRATILGLRGGDSFGVIITDPATLDAAVDHARAAAPPPEGSP